MIGLVVLIERVYIIFFFKLEDEFFSEGRMMEVGLESLLPVPDSQASNDQFGGALNGLFQGSTEKSVLQASQVSFIPLSPSEIPPNLKQIIEMCGIQLG